MTVTTSSLKQELTLGLVCSPLALVPTHPIFVFKTFATLKAKFPPMSQWWAGYSANAASGAISEGTTFGMRWCLIQFLGKREGLTPQEDMVCSAVAGIGGSPANCVAEHGMIRQQWHGSTFWNNMGQIVKIKGWRGIFAGTTPTAGRDALFFMGVFPITDAMKVAIAPHIFSPLWQDIIAGGVAGGIASALGTPCDVVKTWIQKDSSGLSLTPRKTAKKIVASEGVRGLFRGLKFQMLTNGSLICATVVLKARLPDYFPTYLK